MERETEVSKRRSSAHRPAESSVLTINYPPRVRVPVRSERVGNWPNDSFAWVKRLMRESAARTVVSPEILTYHSYVLGDTEMPGEGELTRNLDVVENIIVFLNENIGPASSVLELCAGTGICTIPLSQYYSVVAIDNNERYCSLFSRYLKEQSHVGDDGAQQVELFQADVRQRESVLVRLGDRTFAAVILNPPFDAIDIIRASFEVATAVTPDIIVGVLPLDVIEEAVGSYSWRSAEQPGLVEKDRQFIAELRVHWELIALEPTIRLDGTAQVGTFVFKRAVNEGRESNIAR